MSIEWTFEGPPEKDDNLVYYTKVRARWVKGKSTRLFKIGQCVRIESGDPGTEWIAQIVELFDRGPPNAPPSARMRLSLRWLYDPSDIQHWSASEKNGLYFSDHVDSMNAVECIAGKAFLFDSNQKIKAFKQRIRKEKHPDNWWIGDQLILVRYFYKQDLNPTAVRRLDPDELDFLLENPSSAEMYHAFQNFKSRNSGAGPSTGHRRVVSLQSAPMSPSKRKTIVPPEEQSPAIDLTDTGQPSVPNAQNFIRMNTESFRRKRNEENEGLSTNPSKHVPNTRIMRSTSEVPMRRRVKRGSRREKSSGEQSKASNVARKRSGGVAVIETEIEEADVGERELPSAKNFIRMNTESFLRKRNEENEGLTLPTSNHAMNTRTQRNTSETTVRCSEKANTRRQKPGVKQSKASDIARKSKEAEVEGPSVSQSEMDIPDVGELRIPRAKNFVKMSTESFLRKRNEENEGLTGPSSSHALNTKIMRSPPEPPLRRSEKMDTKRDKPGAKNSKASDIAKKRKETEVERASDGLPREMRIPRAKSFIKMNTESFLRKRNEDNEGLTVPPSSHAVNAGINRSTLETPVRRREQASTRKEKSGVKQSKSSDNARKGKEAEVERTSDKLSKMMVTDDEIRNPSAKSFVRMRTESFLRKRTEENEGLTVPPSTHALNSRINRNASENPVKRSEKASTKRVNPSFKTSKSFGVGQKRREADGERASHESSKTKVKESETSRISNAKSFIKMNTESFLRKRNEENEGLSVPPSGDALNSGINGQNSETRIERSESVDAKKLIASLEQSEALDSARKRKEPEGERSVSPLRKTLKPPESSDKQVFIEDLRKHITLLEDKVERSKNNNRENSLLAQKLNERENEPPVVSDLQTNHTSNIAEHADKFEIERVRKDVEMGIDDMDLELPDDTEPDHMDLEPPRNTGVPALDVMGQLAVSIEQLSDEQKLFALNNIDDHVRLILSRMKRHGFDLSTMDDVQKRAFAKEITNELVE